ncbi:HAD family hydrolase [Saccharicrinis sp. FJH54]|uniref:HAD family hydrolase n=1 Tax=Saccharicrinis sp. FJH54 TaxID=3344665 RepID=UPI0035D4602E
MALKNNFEKTKGIIWDWNGTLLNDVEYSVDCINKLLKKRGMRQLSQAQYKQVFTFPVRDYYESIGFDFNKENWETVAMEFMKTYWMNMNSLKLYADAIDVLQNMKRNGLRQFIVSAMEHEKLNQMVQGYSLGSYFDAVLGISDHFGNGKAHLGSTVLDRSGLKPDEVVWVGDSFHDYEVAGSIGIQTIFVSSGHQSRDVLNASGCKVFDSLSDIRLI